MEILLLFAGIIFFVIGLITLIKTDFSEQSRYSWRMRLLVGGIVWIGFYLLLRNNGRVLLSLPGSGIFSIVLAAVGLIFIIWRKKVAVVSYKLYIPGLKSIFGGNWQVDWDNSWTVKVLHVVFVVVGIFLLLAAYANYYGPK